ncbi:regulator [Vibrio fluvialis]|uniref:regulator n=1 Tax=Vibrio fluvialis TaxID=676 RepID=UPI0030B8DDED
MSKEQTAKLCFKTVRVVTGWDNGKEIPPECKRLMRMYKRLDLSNDAEWKGFSVYGTQMKLPTGALVTPQQILTGIALLEIQSDNEKKILSRMLKYCRCINKIKKANEKGT